MVKEHVTEDVGLAAYCLTVGEKFSRAPFIQGYRVKFAFEDTPEFQKHCSDYFSGKTSVDAQTVIQTTRRLRNLILEIRTNTSKEVYLHDDK